MKKIGFVGMGNMGMAIAEGLIDKGKIAPENIMACARNYEKLKTKAQKIGFVASNSLDEMISKCDVIIIAVNPHEVKNVMESIRDNMKSDSMVISVASSLKITFYENYLGSDKKFARVMPNTLIQSGAGYSAVCFNNAMDTAGKEIVTKILSYLGKVLEIEEELFDSFTTYSCTGPFWIYKFMEAMIDAGVYLGFPRLTARDMVIENLIGVGNVMVENAKTPTDMINNMTSPGGNTIEGVRALYSNGMGAAVMESMVAVLERCKARS